MLSQGDAVGRYKVVRTLGSGGMATVYLVQHAQLGTLQALKVLDVTSPRIRDRLLQEGRIQGSLRHPGVVTVTDVLDIDGAPGLLMEFVDGPPLDAFLKSHRLTLHQARRLGARILRAVAAAHRAGLVHRDLKPANILLHIDDDGLHPKITDFGLAKVASKPGEEGMTRSGVAMGTPSYMAPEQIKDASTVDERADVFSLGAILYELVTGQRCFTGPDTLAIFENVGRVRYVPPRELVPDIPEEIERAIVRCLVAEPDARLPDVDAVLGLWGGVSSEGSGTWDGAMTMAREYSESSTSMSAIDFSTPASDAADDTFHFDGAGDAFTLPPDDLPPADSATVYVDEPAAAPQPPPPPPSRPRWLLGVVGLGAAAALAAVGWTLFSEPAPTEVVGHYLYLDQAHGGYVGRSPIDPSVADTLPHWWVVERDGKPIRLTFRVGKTPTALDVWDMVDIFGYEQVYGEDGRLETIVELYRDVPANVTARLTWKSDTVVQRDYVDTLGRPVRAAWTDQRLAEYTELDIFREVQTLDADGRLIETRYQTSNGQPMAGDDRAFGARLERDEQGRLVRRESLDANGQPTLDATNLVSEVYAYDDADRIVSFKKLGVGGQPHQGRDWVHEIRYAYDATGRPTEQAAFDLDGNPAITQLHLCHRRTAVYEDGANTHLCFGVDGEPARSRALWHGTRAEFDPDGKRLSATYLGLDGKPEPDQRGVAVVRYERLDNGQMKSRSYYGLDGEPAMGSEDWHQIFFEYDARGNILSKRFVDRTGQPALKVKGFSVMRYVRDEAGRKTEVSFYDDTSQRVHHSDGYAIARHRYDDQGNHIEEAFFDAQERPVASTERVAMRRFTFDAQGRKTGILNFGVDGKVVSNAKGWARQETDWDSRGNMIEHRYYGPDNTPVVNVDGYASVKMTVDAASRTIGFAFFDPMGQPWAEGGYYAYTNELDERGLEATVRLFEAPGIPAQLSCAVRQSEFDARGEEVVFRCLGSDELPGVIAGTDIHEIRRRRDDAGRSLRAAYFGVNGTAALAPSGYASVTMTYPRAATHDSPTEAAWFGVQGEPVVRADYGYHRRVSEITADGFEMKRIAYDTEGNRAKLKDGMYELVAEVNERGYLVGQRYNDIDGKPMRDMPARVVYGRDSQDREVGRVYYDADGQQVVHPEHGYARRTRQLDQRGNVLEEAWFGADGTPLAIDGYARVRSVFDGYDREIQRRWFLVDGSAPDRAGYNARYDAAHHEVTRTWVGPDDKPVAEGMARRVQRYDRMGRVSHQAWFSADGAPVDGPNGCPAVDITYDRYGSRLDTKCTDAP